MPSAGKDVHYPDMGTYRTTDRTDQTIRTSGFSPLGALLALLLIPASAAAADLKLGLQLLPAALHMPQHASKLQVSLTWPTSCLPTVDRVAMFEDRIDVTLRAVAARCTTVSTPFELVLDPGRAAGAAILEPRVYGVHVHLAKVDSPSELVAFGLLDASGSGRRSLPENGFWWSIGAQSATTQSLNGTGISLERQGDRLAVTLLGYEAGEPAWYFGSATMSNTVARVPLMRMSGGSEPFSAISAIPVAHSGPVLNLQFETPARARAWLERQSEQDEDAIELQEIALVHPSFADGAPGSGWRGTWILVESDRGSSRLIDLSRMRTRDAETFRLANIEETLSLDCRTVGTGAHAQPAVCTLAENEVPIATLDRVGLDRMRGHAMDGSQVQLLRLHD
ncbi:MAG: hypothetical protein ABI650_11875 [Dokdonella sp.]